MAPLPADHLSPSELGTKDYWDSAYSLELQNHAARPDDEGTIWFSDASAEERVLAHLETLSDESILSKTSTTFLDLGTGNGHLLFALREDGWEGNMLGVDYSAASVELARRIGEGRKEEGQAGVRFEEWDILNEQAGGWLGEGWDVVLDKGTFDAISLSGQVDEQGRRICEGYRVRVEPLIKAGGRLVITSCNWTSDELRAWFEVEGGQLEYETSVKYPSFTFGGKTGQQVCTLSFTRRADRLS
ncbi:S-adenosyl-L-methionine-dependent methyltransferase [Mytilinidion resinicola]|uniref:Protein-lysine N-methyltransferase EFM4 n=1 Tax=Mytilinidion resinicola TaxID=574789 RepID=A0A6A6Z911_9PEZI|nr:S-adenosyl-L-methionine-dependent methyltransferase [Mytilinidion resinicola]KAF2817612.1 S-adenosyl-L-methionine-dependent methyltransferase [Mytilinidion resinicola]